MRAVVIVESCFGNTQAIAEALVAGLTEAGVTVSLLDAATAPASPDSDLIVVAAPTHNLGLSTPASRAKAGESGGEIPAEGVREWLERSTPTSARLVTVDTAVAGMFSGSAAKKALQLARKRGWRAERGESFIVTGTSGPLADGERERARVLGLVLAGG